MLNNYTFTTDGENVVCTRNGETRTYRYKHKEGFAFYVRKTFIGNGYGIGELLRELNDPFWYSVAEQIWATTKPIKAA